MSALAGVEKMRLRKETALTDGRKLLAYWANNAGRGTDNCTLIVVDGNFSRPARSAMVLGSDRYATERTSSWSGDVNMSKSVIARLGITKQQLGAK